jgi:hypothetical protein
VVADHVYLDRSRLETKGSCPRKYYWNYQYKGRGIQLAREIPPPWALLTGTYTHNGIEHVLKGANPAEAATVEATNYIYSISPLFNDIEDGPAKDNLIRQLQEQSQLVTALVYGWSKVRLPDYLSMYEPLDIEREEEITFTVGETEVTLLTRTDILSLIRGSDNRMIHNLKSCTQADDNWRRQWRYDQQTLTEYIAVENRIGKTINGVIIEGLVKGRKSEYPEDSGNWSHNNPMIYQWIKADDSDYQAKYKWRCDAPHQMSRGKECPGGQNHTRSGYYKGSVADKFPGGIISWIDHLVATEPETLSTYFVTLPPITRSDWEVERWKRQTLAREIEDVRNAREIDRLITIDPEVAATLLDYHFPMNSSHSNCFNWGTPCQYLGICWGSADPDDTSKYRPRIPNHPREGV